MTTPAIEIPERLKPADGRFGAGPSKVSTQLSQAVGAAGSELLGTSHRQAPVRTLVASVQDGIATLFEAPEDYRVVLGVGGATAFWDIASFGLIRNKAQHLSFGEFGSKFAKATHNAPFLDDSVILQADPGTRPVPRAEAGIDVYAWPQNETSTGVAAPCIGSRAPIQVPWCSSMPPLGLADCLLTYVSQMCTTSHHKRILLPTAGSGWAFFHLLLSTGPKRSP